MKAVADHRVHGLRTHIKVTGDGPPVLLIGGIWSQASLWDELTPFLDGYRAVAFDPPGIGATDLPRLPYTLGKHAEFAAAVMDAVGVEKAHVIGVSLGGAVAQELARRYPDRVDRLVLVSTGYGMPGQMGRLSALRRFARPGVYSDKAMLEKNAPAMFGGRLRREPELVHRWPLRSVSSRKAYLYRLGGATGWSSLPWVSRLTQPTLVVHGDDDPIVPLYNGKALTRLIPRARLHLVRGGGHLLLLDTADEVLPVITGFLSAEESHNVLPFVQRMCACSPRCSRKAHP